MNHAPALGSGSTSGRAIPIAAVATPGTLLHTAVAGSTSFDEIYVWVNNTGSATAKLTIQWGGVLDPGDHIADEVSIPGNSPPVLVVAGIRINGGLAVRAFSDIASALNATLNVNRITP